MKKAVRILLILFMTVSVFACGFLLGRNTNRSDIQISSPTTSVPTETGQTATKPSKGRKININTADADELSVLPGIGPVLADRIITYRKENGPFLAKEELSNVRGIGSTVLDALLDYITIGGSQ